MKPFWWYSALVDFCLGWVLLCICAGVYHTTHSRDLPEYMNCLLVAAIAVFMFCMLMGVVTMFTNDKEDE